MNDMIEYCLKDIATIKSGKRLPLGHTLLDEQTDHPYIKARDIRGGKVNSASLQHVSDETFRYIKRYIVETNDVCITIVANIGDVGIVPSTLNGANLTENAVRLTKFKKFVLPLYLNQLLSTKFYKDHMELLAAGAAQSKLGIYKIEKLKVQLPPFHIQEKVSTILNSYDNLIEINNQRIKLLEETARELYKEWFVRMRFPGYKNAKFEKGIPEGWEVARIDSLYQTSSGGTPSRTNSEFYENGVYNWVKTGELNDSFIFETNEKISELALKKSSAKLFPPYTVIFAMYGNTIGQLGITSQHAATNQACCALMPLTKPFGFEFIFLTLLLNRPEIISFGMGAAQQNVSQDELKKYKILRPTAEVAEYFKNLTNPIFKQIENLQQQNTQLRQIRDRLLPRLISGKLKVNKDKEVLCQ